MEITRTSTISGITRTREISVTEAQLQNWGQGMHIQDAMPNVSAGDREFLMNGVTPEEWNEIFGECDCE